MWRSRLALDPSDVGRVYDLRTSRANDMMATGTSHRRTVLVWTRWMASAQLKWQKTPPLQAFMP
jgi:hypothetical protein